MRGLIWNARRQGWQPVAAGTGQGIITGGETMNKYMSKKTRHIFTVSHTLRTEEASYTVLRSLYGIDQLPITAEEFKRDYALIIEDRATPETVRVRVPAEVVERICDYYEAWFGISPAGMAMEDETWFVYEKKPELALEAWEPTSLFARISRPERFNLPTPDTLDWRESWHPRPGAKPRRDYVTTAIEA